MFRFIYYCAECICKYFRTSFLAVFAAVCIVPAAVSINISCEFKVVENCTENCYQCTARNLVITKHFTAIDGSHDGVTQNVTSLRIIDQLFHYIPTNFEEHFPHLSILKIWSSGLRVLSQKNIKSLHHLTILSLLGNHLEILDSNLFEFNQRLTKVDFTRNRLKHVGINLLKPLKLLMFADFFDNDCINDGAQYSFDFLKRNLREKCKPSSAMMLSDIDSQSIEIDHLRAELEKREKKIKACTDGKDAHASLNELFPLVAFGKYEEIDFDES